tara:strand:+ start:1215 stop:1484 length:270 start_codon:yes stop_codon:yes gene_type:complete
MYYINIEVSKMASLSVEIMGWVGALLLLTAYFMITHHELDSKSKKYQFMNLFGALFIGVNTFSNHAYPSFTANMVWLVVAFYGLYKIYF